MYYTLLPLTPHSLPLAFEDGTDRGFRNVGQLQIDAGEIPKRTFSIFKSRRKSEIKKTSSWFFILQLSQDARSNKQQTTLQFVITCAAETKCRKFRIIS